MDTFTKISEEARIHDAIYMLEFENEAVDTYYVEVPGLPDTLIVDADMAVAAALTAFVTLFPDSVLAGDYSDWIDDSTNLLGAASIDAGTHAYNIATDLSGLRLVLKIVISNATNSGKIAVMVGQV